MDQGAAAGPWEARPPIRATRPGRPAPPPWSESGTWLLFGLLSCGLLTAVGFFLIGRRYQRRDWTRWAAFYGLVGVAVFVVAATVPRDASGRNVSGTGWQDVVGPLLLVVLLLGLVQSVAVHLLERRRWRAWLPVGSLPIGAPWPAVVTYDGRRGSWPVGSGTAQPTGAPSPYGVPGALTPPAAWSTRPAVTLPAGSGAPVSAVTRDVPRWAETHASLEPWAGFVRAAERARERFHRSTGRVPRGPLRTTLGELAGRVDAGVAECHRIANGGRVLAEARAAIDTAAIDAAVRDAVARQADDPDDQRVASTISALYRQRATAARMDEVIDDTISQLRLLDARMGEAVARMLELSAQAEAAVSVPDLSSDVDGLLADLEALRLAVEEAHAAEVLGPPASDLVDRLAPPQPSAPDGWDQPG